MDYDMYGVIKWIGSITGSQEVYAGIEMVSMYKCYTNKHDTYVK